MLDLLDLKVQNCTKYLTLLHCAISDWTDCTDWTDWTNWTDWTEWGKKHLWTKSNQEMLAHLKRTHCQHIVLNKCPLMKNGQIDLQRWLQWWDLEDCEQGTGDGVKVGGRSTLGKVEVPPKQLVKVIRLVSFFLLLQNPKGNFGVWWKFYDSNIYACVFLSNLIKWKEWRKPAMYKWR